MTYCFRALLCVGLLSLFVQTELPVARAADVVSDARLALQQAETLALKRDLLIAKSRAVRSAMLGQAAAADTLPDPRLTLGVLNLSSSTYEFDQEAMTQGVIGLSQALPPWGSLTAQHAKFNALADEANAVAEDRGLQVIRNVRRSWLSVYYRYHALQLIRQSLKEFDGLIQITRYQYRAGRGKQQDVIRAQLEQSLLRDKELEQQGQWQAAQARLGKWIGRAAFDRELDMTFPYLPDLLQREKLKEEMQQHPAFKAGQSHVNATQHDVEYSDARFHPGWMIDVKYGYRAGGRDNFVSAMVSLDLPFFTGQRQSQQLLASKALFTAAKNDLDDLRRDYKRRFDEALAKYQRGAERVTLYREQVLPEAKQNTEAAMNAYQSGVSDFNAVVRARLAQLDSRLGLLKLEVGQARAQIELLYLAGG